MKKDFDEKLVKQQKQFFDLFNSERIVSSAYRQDVSKQLTIILEKLNPDENLRTINDRFSQLEQKLEQMNLSGSEDRKALLDGILHMQGQPPSMPWRPMQSTPLNSFPRYHQPPHLDPSRMSPLQRGSMNTLPVVDTIPEENTLNPVQPEQQEGSVHNVQGANQENAQGEHREAPVSGIQESYQQPITEQPGDNVPMHLHPSLRFQQNQGGYMKEEFNQYGHNNTGEDMVQIALLKQLRRDYTSSKDWPRFNGEGEYNHNEFIDWVDQTVEEQGMPDKLGNSQAKHCPHRSCQGLVCRKEEGHWLYDLARMERSHA